MEPVDNDTLTDAERQYQDSYFEIDIYGDGDADADDGYGVEGANDSMTVIVPFD